MNYNNYYFNQNNRENYNFCPFMAQSIPQVPCPCIKQNYYTPLARTILPDNNIYFGENENYIGSINPSNVSIRITTIEDIRD